MANPRKFLSGGDFSGQKAINLADGSAATDAASWGQVQQLLAGLAWKTSVRALSTANVSLASAPATIDGVSLANGDRVLLRSQTSSSENGVYVYSSAGSPLTRAQDVSTAAQLKAATVLVTEGSPGNADTAWTQTADNVTVGTTALTWVQFGAGMQYSPGNGLTLTSGTFAIKLPGSGVVGLVVDGTGVYIDTTVVVRKYAANVGDGSSTSITLTHNLGTKDVVVDLYDSSTGATVDTDVTRPTVNTVVLAFPSAPASAAYRAVVHA